MRACRAGYYGLISHIDIQIGRLVQYLRDTKLLNDALILFTSDHREQLGDRNMLAKLPPTASNCSPAALTSNSFRDEVTVTID